MKHCDLTSPKHLNVVGQCVDTGLDFQNNSIYSFLNLFQTFVSVLLAVPEHSFLFCFCSREESYHTFIYIITSLPPPVLYRAVLIKQRIWSAQRQDQIL